MTNESKIWLPGEEANKWSHTRQLWEGRSDFQTMVWVCGSVLLVRCVTGIGGTVSVFPGADDLVDLIDEDDPILLYRGNSLPADLHPFDEFGLTLTNNCVRCLSCFQVPCSHMDQGPK